MSKCKLSKNITTKKRPFKAETKKIREKLMVLWLISCSLKVTLFLSFDVDNKSTCTEKDIFKFVALQNRVSTVEVTSVGKTALVPC